MKSQPPAFDEHAFDEREWQAQERARRAPPAAAPGDGYALVARALREPPLSPLPADFAAEVARRAVAERPGAPAEPWLERLLGTALGLALAVAGLITALVYGGTWLQAVADALPRPPTTALPLGMMLAVCVGLSWLVGQVGRPAGRSSGRRG
ncbi:hypothetical protein [Dokdonella koreensis]|uniref:Uncharacterized protein n=1 Tax=Dokdonella koreensis DS-123 TaxID=1300342 RepID=A0A160DT65_9GAMM|nr:hypothetical protein [Dokdonella koreensis]ANB17525.1 Hypothetical protein I596_1499 [Dokdonella koreensis DS-123]